jgi:hypothetical protein
MEISFLFGERFVYFVYFAIKCSFLSNFIFGRHFLNFTPLKISNRTAVETSTKLPVTDLKQAPSASLEGADSNLHRYK